ncbi:MAG TPA: class I SAM-dependent methyltransferase [Gemmatimonadaceae bacterium]|nr:class I SAM-dependent methyltransferase [Gemmatimonadaceae bacterium]
MTDPQPRGRLLGAPPEIATAYDRWAASYDVDRNATRDLDADVVQRAPLVVADRDVLELGCGTGKNTAWLAGRARSVVGLDFSEGMLARARSRVPAAHVRFVRHDVQQPWPVRDASVDLVVGNLVLEHVEHLGPIFAQAARVLRAGGQLFLCELHPYRQWRGGQAGFADGETGETIRVPAHVHTVAEYVNGGLARGFTLRELGEWLEAGAPSAAPPRLLSVLFELPRP